MYVKLIEVREDGKMSFAMKDCDQHSGIDLNPDRDFNSFNKHKGSKQNQNDNDIVIPGSINYKGEQVKMSQNPRFVESASSNNKFGSITGIFLETEDSQKKMNAKNRIASPDLWEYSRLKGGNVLNLIEDKNIEGIQNAMEHEFDEEMPEIELNDKEAPFLSGQTSKAGLCLSPIKITMNPDGSL